MEGVTFEEVAARSGVAKSTLYRHFGSRDELIIESARGCLVEHPTPDTGSLEGDLTYLFQRFGKVEDERRINDITPLLMDEARRNPEIQALLDSMIAERRRPILTVLQLAQLRGEISPDLDLDIGTSSAMEPSSSAMIAAAIPGLGTLGLGTLSLGTWHGCRSTCNRHDAMLAWLAGDHGSRAPSLHAPVAGSLRP